MFLSCSKTQYSGRSRGNITLYKDTFRLQSVINQVGQFELNSMFIKKSQLISRTQAKVKALLG